MVLGAFSSLISSFLIRYNHNIIVVHNIIVFFHPMVYGLVYWGLTPQQQPGSYQGGEMMMKSVFWWRKPEYPEETTDLKNCGGRKYINNIPM